MGMKKIYTVKTLFRKFAVSLIALLAAAILLPIMLQTIAVHMGLTTRADQSELQVKAIVPTLTAAPDITKAVMPQACRYLILDKEFHELHSNMSADEKEAARSYAKGEYINQGSKRQYILVVRENELCVLQYFIGSQFTASWVPDFFPSPDTLMLVLIAVNALLVIAVLTARFAKIFCSQLYPLMEATKEISRQNLDFEVGHSKIKEFEDVLRSFSSMKGSLKSSLEKQWKAERSQREQIAALAHDLKTPLTVIQGNIDLIGETELDEEQRLYAGYITESSEQIGVYIKALIDISRTKAGYQLRLEEFDAADYMEQIKAQADALCLAKGICLRMETGTDLGTFKADKLLLERAIMNVIGNALDYSPPKGTVYASVQKADGFLQITITDEGSGFTPEALHHAQEQFFMGNKSRTFNMHFGMGLYITSSIIKQHNGQLILKNSDKTKGAQVIIKIPY